MGRDAVSRVVGLALVAVPLAFACGGSESTSGSGSPGQQASHCPAVTGPPENVNLDVCRATTDDGSSAALSACGSCCTAAGFSSGGFIDGDACKCANSPADDAGAPCSANVTADACSACCYAHDALGFLFIGEDPMLGTSSKCECDGRSDAKICACALADQDPSASCEHCCLENGYIGMAYTGFGTLECRCNAP